MLFVGRRIGLLRVVHVISFGLIDNALNNDDTARSRVYPMRSAGLKLAIRLQQPESHNRCNFPVFCWPVLATGGAFSQQAYS